jgi:hypothetical protein
MWRSAFIVAAILLLANPVAAQDKNPNDESARLTLQVVAGEDKQPVADAHVVVRFAEERMLRRNKTTSWETKTNRKGVAVLAGIPLGAIKVQVIAKGYQTYGDEHELSQTDEELTIQLQTPQGQVSAY